jgi:hypothetical protein
MVASIVGVGGWVGSRVDVGVEVGTASTPPLQAVKRYILTNRYKTVFFTRILLQ